MANNILEITGPDPETRRIKVDNVIGTHPAYFEEIYGAPDPPKDDGNDGLQEQ